MTDMEGTDTGPRRRGPGDPFPVVDSGVIDRERRVLDLRAGGMTFDRIASNLGYADRGAAHKAYRRALTRTLKQPAQDVRDLEEYRLDRLLSALWPKAMGGDAHAAMGALRIMDRRAKLLGLDHADQLAERAQSLAESQGAALAQGLSWMLEQLGMAGDPRGQAAAVAMLERLHVAELTGAEDAVVVGELVDDEEVSG
jgi:hypothetical protein